MLMSAYQLGFGAGGRAVSVVFTANVVSTSDLTEYTFSSVAIGTARSDRKVVVGPRKAGGSANAVSTLTVGGVSATVVVAVDGGGGSSTELWQADVPTGTTGDIVVTWTGAATRCGIGVFAVYDAASAASDTASSTADPMSTTLAIPASGIAIGVGGDSGTSTYTWTNLTEHYDEDIESGVGQTGASEAFVAAQPSLTITCDPSNAGSEEAMALAAWGPA